MNLRRHLWIGLLLAAGWAMLSAGAQGAEEFQSLTELRELVRQFLQDANGGGSAEPEIEVSTIDNRLRLNHCERALETYLPPSGNKAGRVTVGVRCTGASPWSLYVPAQVRLLDQVVVVKQDLTRGTLLGAEDVELQQRDLASLTRGYLLKLDEAVGRTLDRPVRRGQVLAPAQLETPNQIKRGEKVSIIASIGGIEARMQGKALARGNPGERIKVLNLSSGKELEARVISAGTVRVDI